MSSPRTWTVVVFQEDNSVQAVPTKWLNEDNCLWPVVPQDKLAKALRNCEFNTHWPSHKVRILRNATYDDYATAREKAVKAEYTSDLNSEDEKDNNKRSRKKRLFSSSDSDEDNEVILKTKNKKVLKPLPAPPLPPPHFEARKFEEEKRTDDIDIELLSETPGVNKVRNKRQEDLVGSSRNSNCRCNPQILLNIQSLIMDLHTKMDSLNTVKTGSSPENNVLEKSKLVFPIQTQDTLDDMETFLDSQENYKSMVSYFSRMGGANGYDFVKRCLSGILSDSVGMQFSFIGRKGKKKFNKLQISMALLESAEISGLFKDKKEAENCIGSWLRKAKERFSREVRRT